MQGLTSSAPAPATRAPCQEQEGPAQARAEGVDRAGCAHFSGGGRGNVSQAVAA